jgi:hypothetical protein
VPVRAVPPFAATLNETVPLPDPEAPAVSVIQSAFVTAVHAQPSPAVTATVPVPPADATGCDAGAIEKLHGCGGGGGGGGGGGAASCETVNV